MLDWSEVVEGFSADNERDLIAYVEKQRWFGGKGRTVTGIGLIDRVVLRDDPRLLLALGDVHFDTGNSDIYQFVIGLRRADGDRDIAPTVTVIGDTALYGASSDPEIARLVGSAHGDGLVVPGVVGDVTFRNIRDIAGSEKSVRPLNLDQSNTSIVLNEQLLVKMYRRLEGGINPELELLLFLTERGFQNIPELAGWCSYSGTTLRATLGLAQRFVPDSIDGWNLGLTELADSPERFLGRLTRLGEVIGDMHCVLASDAEDPDFSPEDPTAEASAILEATLEEQIDALSESIPDGKRHELRTLARLLTQSPLVGRLIRCHGDLHLGQLLWSGEDWLVIDFEGEPARSLAERRQKMHPLRDVAGLLRSFAYLAYAPQHEKAIESPASWKLEARHQFLDAYRERASSVGLLPDDRSLQDRLIRTFELEKILYELQYEVSHRPDWRSIPLAGIDRLLTDSIE